MENASRKTDTGILVDQSPAEIIGGRVVMMSPARTDHQRVARNIARFFGNYLEGKTCEVFGDGALLYLSEENQFIPDGMIVCDPGKIREDGVHGAPDLVVEILSPSTASNDRIIKKISMENVASGSIGSSASGSVPWRSTCQRVSSWC